MPNLSCPYEFALTAEDREALNWLRRVVLAIIEKGPTHKNYENAKNITETIAKLVEYGTAMHGEVRAAKREMQGMQAAFSKLTTMEIEVA